MTDSRFTFVVEHLDPEFGLWHTLEYASIAEECHGSNASFVLSSLSPSTTVPERLQGLKGLTCEHRSVEEIFAEKRDRVCLLDPKAERELSPADALTFDVFLFGGILGDDPPRDRTSELRQKGFVGRRLGPVQMTTDTAVRVTRIVVQEQKKLSDIEIIDHPEVYVTKHESIQMPFRYVKSTTGAPVMPEGMEEVIKQSSDQSIDDLL